jgi:hypothetical protein
VGIFISDSLQIGQNVTTDKAPIFASDGEKEPSPSAEK